MAKATDAVALARTGQGLTGPWRGGNYLVDSLYAEKCIEIFGAPPEQPRLELFIPEEHRTQDLLNAVRYAIWALEWNVIWPHLAELLRTGGVRGDLVEFGVYNGGSFRRHIEIFRPTGVIGRYYGFDSFKGLPRPDRQNDAPLFWQWEGVFSDTSKERVLQYLREGLDDLSDVELVEGLYSDTLPTIRDRLTQIAFVRVDCDLYSSTTDVFNFLFERLVDGAIIYFYDWTHEASTGETKAFF